MIQSNSLNEIIYFVKYFFYLMLQCLLSGQNIENTPLSNFDSYVQPVRECNKQDLIKKFFTVQIKFAVCLLMEENKTNFQ